MYVYGKVDWKIPSYVGKVPWWNQGHKWWRITNRSYKNISRKKNIHYMSINSSVATWNSYDTEINCSKMVGFDSKNKDTINSIYICRLCSLILREPFQLSCGHRQCKTCIETIEGYIKKNKIAKMKILFFFEIERWSNVQNALSKHQKMK
jgi:hypothetical protein